MHFTDEKVKTIISQIQQIGLSEKEAIKALSIGRDLLSVKTQNLKKPTYNTLYEIINESREFDLQETKDFLNKYFNN